MALREVVKAYVVFDSVYLDKMRAFEVLEASPHYDQIKTIFIGMEVIDKKHLNFDNGVYIEWFSSDFIFKNYVEAQFYVRYDNYRKASGKVAL